jgi:hypothetical protein
MMVSGAMVGWCSGSRWPSRFSLGFDGSTDTRAPVRGVRGSDTTKQDGIQQTRVRARGHMLDRRTHGLAPQARACRSMCACKIPPAR